MEGWKIYGEVEMGQTLMVACMIMLMATSGYMGQKGVG